MSFITINGRNLDSNLWAISTKETEVRKVETKITEVAAEVSLAPSPPAKDVLLIIAAKMLELESSPEYQEQINKILRKTAESQINNVAKKILSKIPPLFGFLAQPSPKSTPLHNPAPLPAEPVKQNQRLEYIQKQLALVESSLIQLREFLEFRMNKNETVEKLQELIFTVSTYKDDLLDNLEDSYQAKQRHFKTTITPALHEILQELDFDFLAALHHCFYENNLLRHLLEPAIERAFDRLENPIHHLAIMVHNLHERNQIVEIQRLLKLLQFKTNDRDLSEGWFSLISSKADDVQLRSLFQNLLWINKLEEAFSLLPKMKDSTIRLSAQKELMSKLTDDLKNWAYLANTLPELDDQKDAYITLIDEFLAKNEMLKVFELLKYVADPRLRDKLNKYLSLKFMETDPTLAEQFAQRVFDKELSKALLEMIGK
jgi:hypothetical protein